MAKTVSLEFPLAGVQRKYAYQKQPPYSTPDALNVRPDGIPEGRTRGGSRPGMAKAYAEELGSGNPVRMIDSVVVTSSTSMGQHFEIFESDDFAGGELGDAWSLPTWNAFDRISPVAQSKAGPFITAAKTGAVFKDFDYDTTEPYTVEIFCEPVQGGYHGHYFIYARMNDTTPDPTSSGVIAKLTMQNGTGAYSGTLTESSGAVHTFTSGTDTADGGWFQLLITGDVISVYWRGTRILANQAVAAHTGTRMGFGLQSDSNHTRGPRAALISAFRTRYYLSTPPQQYHTELVASANSLFYYETELYTLARLGGPVNLVDDRQIMSAERGQRLYIADYDTERITGAGTIDATGLILDDTDVADWTAHDIDPDNDVVVISDGTGDVTDGTYKITSVVVGQLNLAASAGGAGTCTYRIGRAPKVWNPSDRTLTIWTATAGKGQVPNGCPLICLYRDRIVLAGPYEDPQMWYMSRSGDPLDFDYGADGSDWLRAVAGNNADAGKVGAPILGMAAHSDDYLIFFCNSQTWVMRGNPAAGGMLDALSYQVGIVGKKAWCKGPEGQLVWLSHDGLYQLPPGAQAFPEPLSHAVVPDELKGIDHYQAQVTLLYNEDEHGIHIYLTPNDAGPIIHWWYDWEGKGFWPMTLPTDMHPTAGHEFHPKEVSRRAMLIGCRDGYIRKYGRGYETDDGTAISSYVLYGPLGVGGADREAVLREIGATMARASGDVAWSIFVGDTPEGVAVETTAERTGTWVAGGNTVSRPRARGRAMMLKLADSGGVPWAVEEVHGTVQPAGRWRK